jgi:MFS-type transporter involved in bile tolerance (Atg22 family)
MNKWQLHLRSVDIWAFGIIASVLGFFGALVVAGTCTTPMALWARSGIVLVTLALCAAAYGLFRLEVWIKEADGLTQCTWYWRLAAGLRPLRVEYATQT